MKRKYVFLMGMLCALSFFFAFPAFAVCDHDYQTKTILLAPTCTTPGREIRICRYCYDEKEFQTSALGHDFSPEFTVDVVPTCGVAGRKSRHCSRCNEVTSITTLKALDHSFTYSTVKPTCTEYGYRLRKCGNCGQEVKDQYVNPTGHTRGQWVVDKAATCTSTGVRSVSCTVCGAVLEQKPIAAAEHKYTERTVSPSCTQSGYTLRTCSVCGAQSKTNTVKALGHNYSDTVVAPTCEEKGYTLRTCTRCGAQTKTNSVKVLGHSFASRGVQTKAPTCTEKGEETVACSRCGKTQTKTVAALGHDYESTWTTDKPSTCTAKGEQSHHCTRCGKRKDVTSLPLADHSPVSNADTAPTCTAAGKTGGTHCAVCGKTLTAPVTVAALGHAFRDSVVLTEPTCTEKGSAQRTCSRCGFIETTAVPALGHSYSEDWTVDKAATCTAQGEQSHHCVRCDKRKDVTATPKTAHFEVTDPVVEPTCAAKGKTAGAHCKTCGKILIAQQDIPATGHEFQTISVITAATCTEKGSALMACKKCGATEEQDVPALGHSYGEDWTIDKEATCAAQGEKSHRCTRCGKRTDVTAIPRVEHTVAYEGVIEPTCTKAGRADRAFCSVCGKELAEKTTIPARGHTEKTTLKRATAKRDGSAVTVCTTCGETLKTTVISRIASVTLSAKKFTFNGKKQRPTVQVKDSAGKTLKEGDCYSVKYASGCKEIGRYTLTVTFRGNYAGSAARSFQIVPQKVTGLDFTSSQSEIKLTWKAVAGATGYKVYLFNEQTKRYTLLKTTKKTRFAMQDLLPGTVYVLCVRAFTKQGDAVFTGALSNAKSTATKPLQPVVTAKANGTKAVLRWNNCGSCVYEVYAAEKKNGKYRLLGTTKKTSFTADGFPAGGTACFKVKAFVRRGTTDLSRCGSEITVLHF